MKAMGRFDGILEWGVELEIIGVSFDCLFFLDGWMDAMGWMRWMRWMVGWVTLGWIKRAYSRDSRDEYEFEDSPRDDFGLVLVLVFGIGFGWIVIFVYVYVLYTALLYCITIVTIAKMILLL